MLKNQSKDLMYLLRILESIGKINLYTSNLEDFEKFYEDDEQKTFNATLTLFGNIGERASKMSEELRIN